MSNVCAFLTIEEVFEEMEDRKRETLLRSIFKNKKDEPHKEEADDKSVPSQPTSDAASNPSSEDLLVEKISEAVLKKIKGEKKGLRRLASSEIIRGIIVGVVLAGLGVPIMHVRLEGRIAALETSMANMNSTIQTVIGKLGADVESDPNQKYDEQEPRTGMIASPYFWGMLAQVIDKFDIVETINSSSVYSDSKSAIAYDNKTGEEIYADELAEQKFLIPYKSGSEDVFFYGQFNKNGHWDGHCVINIYKNGSLERIIDAEYRDGKLVSSQQVFHYWTEYSKEKQNVWAISDRKVFYRSDGSVAYSSGETNLYKRNGDFPQHFDEQELSEDDILDVSDFQSEMDLQLYAKYVGNTSNGRFNDDTGDAYIIYYYADEKAKTLYVGKFADGTINDSTGNAWWITEDTETSDGRYAYYKGRFKDGDVASTKGYEYNISQDRINEILKITGKDSLGLIWRQVGENKV